MEDIYEDLSTNFEQIYVALRRDLARVRTGRASTNLLDSVKVDYYGQPTPISQVASIQIPEARLITVKPWETQLLKSIEKAILTSDIGITPNNDGTLIRLQIPPLTEERRRILSKKVMQLGEQAKISARNHRRDGNQLLKEMQKSGEITEDDLQRALKTVQSKTDDTCTEVDRILEGKLEELKEI